MVPVPDLSVVLTDVAAEGGMEKKRPGRPPGKAKLSQPLDGAVTSARRRGHECDENAIRDPLLRYRAVHTLKLRYKGRFEEISRSTARWTKSHPCAKRWNRAMMVRITHD